MRQYTIKELRARKNITQKTAASMLGISMQTYNAWERDISAVAVGKVVKVADFYGVKLEEIFLPNDLKNIQVAT